ncbi:glycosyltransferase 87 family protein [Streptomyces albidoflavus]
MLALSFTAFVVLCLIQHIAMADTLVYRAEGRAVVTGSDLYGFTVTEWELPATYPPFAAILFVPTTWLPITALKVCFILGNTALLALLVHLSCRLAGRATRAPFLLLAVAVGIWLEPVFQTLLFGQINLALVCLVLWDLTRPAGALGKGFALGVATGVKLTPGIFIVHLLITGRVREGLTALASFTGTVLLGALVLPSATVDFFTRRLYETGRVGLAWIVDNQSLQGLIARTLHTEHPGLAWAVPTALTGLAGLWLARRLTRRLGDGSPWPVLVTAVTGLLVSPISWSHHWVWCVPLLVVLLARGRTILAAALTVLFLARPHWLLPHQGDLDLHFPWWQQPLGAPYPFLGLGLLAAAAWAAYGRRGYGESGPRVPRQGVRGVGSSGAGEPVGERAG